MSELLLPSEERRRKLLQEMETDKQANTPEKGEVPPEGLKSTLNEKYPFLSEGECVGKDDIYLQDLNRCRKIILFYEQPEKYRDIVRQHPEQKFYRDKFDYEAVEPEVKKKQRSTRKDTKKWFD
jgi:CHASE2 domain-containing sensor protein